MNDLTRYRLCAGLQALASAKLLYCYSAIEARTSQNITQEELALWVGTQKSNISRLESGTYNPSLDFLSKVARSLGKKAQITLK